jgi:prepilin-type N-terminal cleavage/methylation domain-containing protein
VRRAYTLIEVIMVVAIMGIILTIATPYFAQLSARQRLQLSANRVMAELKFAASVARATGLARTATVNTTAGSLTLAITPTPTNTQTLNLSKWPHQLSSLDANFGGAKTVTFNLYGQPQTAGTITLRIGQQTKTVSVSSTTGEVTIP